MTSFDEAPADRLMAMLGGKWVCQAVSTAATLGVADVLAEVPLPIEALAERLDCHAPSLARLMAVLIGEGLFTEDDDGRYGLTAMGKELCTGRLRDLARFVGSPTQWAPWSALPETVRTGKPAFELTHGESLYERMQHHAEDAALYNKSVDRFTREQAAALAETYDFSNARRVIDVGGGQGTLMVEVLKRWPELAGAVFDIAHVVEACRLRLVEAGVADRCELIGGDFLKAVPEGGDVYVLKHVLHNWDDDVATGILARCREAMANDGVVLVVEGVLLPGNRLDLVRLLDLEMMVLFSGGRERSKAEFQRMFDAAGLRLMRGTRPLGPFARLLVGRPAS